MKGRSDIWAACAAHLAECGVELVFGMAADGPGLLEAAEANPKLRVVNCRDQRAGALMAIGYVLGSGRPAVYAASSGPGFANAMMALIEAGSLAIPLLVVTNGVSQGKKGRGAFQELDHVAMVAGISKWATRLETGDALCRHVERAVHLACNGRSGVTVIEIPDDLGSPGPSRRARALGRLLAQPEARAIDEAMTLLAAAERPLILAGGGARQSGCQGDLESLATAVGACLLTTASGRGSVDEDHPMACGLSGFYATPPIDELQRDADLLLVMGSQLEETATGAWSDFASLKTIVQVDIDADVIGRAMPVDVGLVGDIRLVVRELLGRLPPAPPSRQDWLERIRCCRQQVLAEYSHPDFRQSPTRAALASLRETFGTDLILVQEDGLVDMWSYHFPAYVVSPPGRTVCPAEQTGLGFALPAAIGAKIACPERPVVAIGGDGAFQFNLGALPSAIEMELGITCIVINNGGFGWPRLWQRAHHASTASSDFRRTFDYSLVATSIGGCGFRPRDSEGLLEALREAKRANAKGKVAVIELISPARDVPAGVRRSYPDLVGHLGRIPNVP